MLNIAPTHTAIMAATPMTTGRSILFIGYRLQWVNKFSSLALIASGIKPQSRLAGVCQTKMAPALGYVALFYRLSA